MKAIHNQTRVYFENTEITQYVPSGKWVLDGSWFKIWIDKEICQRKKDGFYICDVNLAHIICNICENGDYYILKTHKAVIDIKGCKIHIKQNCDGEYCDEHYNGTTPSISCSCEYELDYKDIPLTEE